MPETISALPARVARPAAPARRPHSPLKLLLVMPTSGQQPRVALQSLASLSASLLLLAVLARAQPIRGRKRETCAGLISPFWCAPEGAEDMHVVIFSRI